MCATKPIASWPHSPSRSSSSAWALDGIRSSPRQRLSPAISSMLLACWVIAIGRVCGTAIGTAPMPTTRSPRSARRPRGPPREALPAGVRLRPVQQQVRRAAGVAQQPDHQPRGVVGLVVVAHERHGRTPGAVVVELVDVEGGHDRAVGLVDEVPRRTAPRRCRRRGSRRAPAPASAGRARRRRARAPRRRCAPAAAPCVHPSVARGRQLALILQSLSAHRRLDPRQRVDLGLDCSAPPRGPAVRPAPRSPRCSTSSGVPEAASITVATPSPRRALRCAARRRRAASARTGSRARVRPSGCRSHRATPRARTRAARRPGRRTAPPGHAASWCRARPVDVAADRHEDLGRYAGQPGQQALEQVAARRC